MEWAYGFSCNSVSSCIHRFISASFVIWSCGKVSLDSDASCDAAVPQNDHRVKLALTAFSAFKLTTLSRVPTLTKLFLCILSNMHPFCMCRYTSDVCKLALTGCSLFITAALAAEPRKAQLNTDARIVISISGRWPSFCVLPLVSENIMLPQ